MPYGEWCEFCKAYHDSIDSYKRFIDNSKDIQYPAIAQMVEQKRLIVERHDYNVMLKDMEDEDA